MIKKIIILLVFLCYSPAVFAVSWGDVWACVEDPCNCGDDGDKYETWNGTTYNRGKKNYLCPPWNKNGDRHNKTCLVREKDVDGGGAPGFPGAWILYYENLCAEATAESNYFTPKIRVRGQQCNAVACWTTSNTLDWDGECVTLAGGYALPLHRMCARIALPKDDDRGLAADPGYRKGKHLTFDGAEKEDEPIYGNDGERLNFDSPKLCAYRDPSFFSAEDGFDVMDLDPNKQSYHKTKELHPIVKVIKFFVEAASSIAQSPLDLLGSLFGLMDDGEDGETTFGSVMKDLMSFLGDVIEWVGSLLIDFLDEVGQINRAVDSKDYGCVNLPLGPFPPPYCEQVAPFFQVATISDICPKGTSEDFIDSDGNLVHSNGDFVNSTGNKPCVVSTVINNFINNSVRVGYETLVPLCRNGENPMITDSCVVIENLGPFSSAGALHASTAYRDIIKHCDDAATGSACIKTMLPHTCSVTSNGCQDGFRIVYGEKLGGVLTAKQYFRNDLNDCPSSSSATCQEIWGVNMGEFVDISLPFLPIQTSSDIAPLTQDFTLVDKGNRTAHFNASIVRESGFNTTYSFTQEPNQLCVFEGDFVVGCSDRVPPSGVIIHDCGSASSSVSCSTSHFSPKFVVSYSEDGISTSARIEPLSVYNIGSSANSFINLAGNKFESFVTNDAFITKPFTGTKAPNASSLFGVYQDNALPIAGGVLNEDAVYISGLEYINDHYNFGGTYACLTNVNSRRCPDDIEMCVLTKLLNKDTVRCSLLSAKATKNGGLNPCTVIQQGVCPVADSLSKISGGTINIRDCGAQGKCYDGGVELCKVSQDVADRHIPSVSYGNKLPASQFYDPTASSSYAGAPSGVAINYDADNYGLRSKTSVELGLCAAIPQGTCAAEGNYSQENGYAYWPETELGKEATGTCRSGWHAVRPLKRYCIPIVSKDNPYALPTFGFEPLYRVVHGVFSDDIEYTDIKCIKDDD
ncbi:MAG: hypothetical protein NWR41_04705 [Rickettsiaceae bacterium]|nr:hypothetical protein [Rickettsiaceae bacterium]MDP5082974.1 hypothetical protein [Rickettsiaceae bacterium]